MKHIKSISNFLTEARNLNVTSTGRKEKNLETKRNSLMDVLLKIYEIFEGNPQIVLSQNEFRFKDLLNEYQIKSPGLVNKFIIRHFLKLDRSNPFNMKYSLRSKNIPNWNIVDSIIQDRYEYDLSRKMKIDSRFEGITEEAQYALALKIIKDGIANNWGKISPTNTWNSTNIPQKQSINKICVNLGIYLKKGLRYEWLAKEPFSILVKRLIDRVEQYTAERGIKFKDSLNDIEREALRQRGVRRYVKKLGMESDEAADYIENKWKPIGEFRKIKKAGFDIYNKDSPDHLKYHRITDHIRYHRKKGKSEEEIYNSLIGKPDRYDRRLVDVILNRKSM